MKQINGQLKNQLCYQLYYQLDEILRLRIWDKIEHQLLAQINHGLIFELRKQLVEFYTVDE